MIPVNEMDSLVKRAAKELEPGGYLLFLTAKKDRSLELLKTGGGFLVTEDGFVRASFEVTSEQDLKKLFKRLRQTEFPRSAHLHLQRGTKKLPGQL